MHIGSDSYPFTVVNIVKEKVIEVQQDIAKPTEKHQYYGKQDYTYEPNPDGRKKVISLRKNGGWYVVGKQMGETGEYFIIGQRSAYQDPSF